MLAFARLGSIVENGSALGRDGTTGEPGIDLKRNGEKPAFVGGSMAMTGVRVEPPSSRR